MYSSHAGGAATHPFGRLDVAQRPAWAGVAGLALIGVSAFSFSARTPFPGIAAALPVAGAALVIVSGTGVTSHLLKTPALVWFGDRSYSWYLWHWPAIVLLPLVFPSVPGIASLAALVSLVPAVLSYRYVERRFRLRRGVPARITAPRLALVSVAVPCAVLAVAHVGVQRGWGLEAHPEILEESISQKAGCYKATTSVEQCTFGDGDGRDTIMLVGDSHADGISDAVVEAASVDGSDVVIQTYLACPFLTVSLDFEPDCLSRQVQTSDLIAEMQPDVLIIANNSLNALTALGGTSDGGGPYSPPSDDSLDTWEAALRSTLVDVERSVGHVVLVSMVPYYEPEVFDSALPTLLRPAGAFPTVSVATIEKSRRPIDDAESTRCSERAGPRHNGRSIATAVPGSDVRRSRSGRTVQKSRRQAPVESDRPPVGRHHPGRAAIRLQLTRQRRTPEDVRPGRVSTSRDEVQLPSSTRACAGRPLVAWNSMI